jgi:2-oxoglutarate ferredoxin oxidoreductase subunit alpha
MMETPVVFVNVQRGGPSTGLPTLPAQADMMQARWGSHGDYEIIALSPNSPQECFDLTIGAFNLSEQYRVPVIFLMDECVAHMTEQVCIPSADQIEITPRRYTKAAPGAYLPYAPEADMVPAIAKAGDGYRFHVTGLTHDERGYPEMTAECQEKCVHRLVDKVRVNAGKIVRVEEDDTEAADILVVSYGITSRVALRAVQRARKEGIRVGHLRLVTVWPFPEERVRQLAGRVKAFVFPELNFGQMFLELQRVVEGRARCTLVPHAGGTVHNPEIIYERIREAAK